MNDGDVIEHLRQRNGRLAVRLAQAEADNDELRAELDRVLADYHAQLETVHELNEALAAVLPDLQRAMGGGL